MANLYEISTDTIRYYESEGLIHPQRGENGYRMYSIMDIWRMNVIRDLRGLGFTIPRIREYLNDRNVNHVLRLLEEERKAITDKISYLNELLGNVDARIETITGAADTSFGVVTEADFPKRNAFVIEEQFTISEEVDVIMKRLLNLDPGRSYLIGSSNLGCRVPLSRVNAGAYRSYDAVFLIDKLGNVEFPAGRYLKLRYKGDTIQTRDYVPVLLEYAQENGYTLCGDILELILIDIHEAEDIDEHIAELQVMVKKCN